MRYWFSILLFISIQVSANNSEQKEWWEYIDGSVKIKFQFKEILNHQFLVKGIWSPDGGESGYAGPAELVFKDIHNGSESKINVEDFALAFGHFEGLDIVLNKNDEWYFNPNADLDKTYLVNYYDLDRVSLWNDEDGRAPQPIFFEDINFDGRKELISLKWAAGQRFNNEFDFYQISTQDNETKLTPYYPIQNVLDSSTKFDRANKTIKSYEGGGACWNNYYTYKFENGKYNYLEYGTDRGGIINPGEQGMIACVNSVYDIVNEKKVLRGTSYSFWDEESSDWKNINPEIVKEIYWD